jgi:hypothetical protein
MAGISLHCVQNIMAFSYYEVNSTYIDTSINTHFILSSFLQHNQIINPYLLLALHFSISVLLGTTGEIKWSGTVFQYFGGLICW